MDQLKLILISSGFEFFGTLMYVFLGCASVLVVNLDYPRSMTSIALSFGVSYAVLVNMLAPFSGGHLNPAVTVAMMIKRKVSIARGSCYIAFQLLGGIVASALLYLITPLEVSQTLGANQLDGSMSPVHGLLMEAFLTFMLVYTVLMSGDERSDGLAALWSGLAVTACHLAGLHFTSCGVNPARSLGPAVVTNNWINQWVYWAGPIIGSVVAACLHFCSKNFPVVSLDNSLIIHGEGLELPDNAPQHNQELSLELSNVIQKQNAVSPSLARANIPYEIKTYL